MNEPWYTSGLQVQIFTQFTDTAPISLSMTFNDIFMTAILNMHYWFNKKSKLTLDANYVCILLDLLHDSSVHAILMNNVFNFVNYM